MSRGRGPLLAWLVATLVLCAVTAYLGWISATAVDTGPAPTPVAQEVLARVERAELVDQIRLSCSATRTDLAALSDARESGVVSDLPQDAGTTVRAGDLLVEVDGSPVIAVEGRVRMFRDVKPGDAGPDVDQVRAALATRGAVSDKPEGTAWAVGEQLAWSQHLAALGYEKEGRRSISAEQVLVVSSLPAEAPWRPGALGSTDLASSTLLSADPVLDCPLPQDGAPIPGSATITTVDDESVDLTVVPAAERAQSDGSGPGQDAADPASEPTEGEVPGETGGGDEGGSLRLEGPRLQAADGSEVVVSVEMGRSEDEALVVPLAALRTDAGGRTVVRVGGASGRDVGVTPGFSADGLVQVAPIPSDALDLGDEVVVSDVAPGPASSSDTSP